MPWGRKIGELSTKELPTVVRKSTVKIVECKTTVEWTINDVLSYTEKGESYDSPHFYVADSECHISIYPNGRTDDDTVGWISVYLWRYDDSNHSKISKLSFAVKKKDGTAEKSKNACHVFKRRHNSDGFPYFLQRSELQRRMTELAPSGDLTLVCTLKVTDSLECTSTEITGLEKLSEDLGDMFISERGCDTTLNIEHEKFSVHKSILMARSPVLAAMFDVDMKEKNTGTVDIVDCQPKPFRNFLAYLYTGNFENISDDVFELYRIADKYDVGHLKSACVQRIMSSLSVDNVLKAALVGEQFGECELKSKAQDFFDENVSEIISNERWEAFLSNYFSVGNKLLQNMVEKMKQK